MTRPAADDERLGALLDRRLGEAERAELLARVAASDEESAVLAEAAAVLRAMEGEPAGVAEEPQAVPLRAPVRRTGMPRAAWLALAAVLAAVALGIWAWRETRAPGIGEVERFAVLLHRHSPGLPVGWIETRPWGTTRGAEDSVAAQTLAVRLGVLLLDLELAVRARDADATAHLAREVALSLEPLPATVLIRNVYLQVAEGAGRPPEDLGARLEEGRAAVAGLGNEEFLAAGAWLEGSRIAVAWKDAGFFRKTRLSLDRLSETAPDEPTRAAVERIRSAVRVEGGPRWQELGPDLDAVLAALGS